MDLFDHVPEAEEKEKPEPRTPIPKKKLAKPLFVDLSTPPKEASGGKKPDVITDGAGRGAFPAKAPLPNPTFGGALPDEDAEQDEDDEQDEAAEPEGSTDDSEAEGKGQSAKGRGRGRGRGRGKARGRGRARGHGGKKASAKEKIGKVVTEMQCGPKRKSKKKAVVKPPKKKSCEGEGKDGQEGDKEEEPKRRKRKCKQKVKTDDDKRLAAVQSYLGSLGLTWSFCQSYHARRGFAESVSGKCKGFLAWQNKLGTDFVEPECLLCLSMIRETQFNMEVVRGLVEEALLPFKESPAWKHLRRLNETVRPWIEPQENVMEDGAATECLDIVPYKPPEQDGDQADQEEDQAGKNVAREPVNPGLIIIRMGQAHVLQALPNSNRGRMCKIRCRVCRSKQQPNGRTFQCNTSRANDIRHFIKQHLKGPNHIANMARWAKDMQREQDGEPEPVADTHHVPCQGACLTTGQNRTSIFRSELLLWATMTQMKKDLAKHTYFLDLSGDVIAFHENCRKVLPQPEEGKRAVCAQCEDQRLADRALRSALRLNLKYHAAKILEARLFKSPERLIEVQEEMRSTRMYKMNPKSVDDVVTDNTVKLQKWIRQSFLKANPDVHSSLFQEFIDVTVRPCLAINVSDCGVEMKQMANSFTKAIACEQFSRDSMEHLCVRIMEKTAKGTLASNPVAMGIVLQCLEYTDRLERDVQSMKKTRLMSDREKAVVEEAAMTLAMNG